MDEELFDEAVNWLNAFDRYVREKRTAAMKKAQHFHEFRSVQLEECLFLI